MILNIFSEIIIHIEGFFFSECYVLILFPPINILFESQKMLTFKAHKLFW